MITATLIRTLFWFWVSMGALGAEVWIKSADEFLQFENNVNGGANYKGTTVFLDSDIDLAGKSFGPIGTNSECKFRVVFDGQGHVINNLKMISSSQYVGLFGCSKGLNIKNVVLESSCSITSSGGYVGGFIGYCHASNGPCTIENSVSMGCITFSGSISGNDNSLYLGGVAGDLYSDEYDSTIKNCANYGDVIHSGTSGYSYIGGIVGRSYGSSSSKRRVYIYNSLNHGTISYKGTTSGDLCLGGITGWTQCATIENCVGGGKISSSKSSYIGSIIGLVSSSTSIKYCYFTNDLDSYREYGYGTPSSECNTLDYDSTLFQLSGTVSIGSYSGNSLIDALNGYADYKGHDYSNWLLNKNNSHVSFTINERTPFILNSQIILLPSLASEGKMRFDGWYEDKKFTTPLTSFEITNDTDLYGLYGLIITVVFEPNLESTQSFASKKVVYGCKYGDLPTPTRTGNTFSGWFTEVNGGTNTTADDIVKITVNQTLYAHWTINNYTLTFDFSNGTEPEVRILEYNETITYPAEPMKAGYSFNGWDKNNLTCMPANNTIITAQWTQNNYTVTFNPKGGNISQPSTKSVTFGSPYGDLPAPTRKNFTFVGWFTNSCVKIKGESIVNISDNHTLDAYWFEFTPSQVEITFSTKNLTREDVEKIVKKYIDFDVVIIKVEDESSGDTRFIIEFHDIEKARSFVETVNGSNEANKTIKKVGFIQESARSFSRLYHPIFCLLGLFII